MIQRKILLFVPIATVAGFLIYTWSIILFTENIAGWRHYSALILFAGVVYCLFTSFKKAVLATGVFLIIGTFNLFSITPDVLLSWGIRVGSLEISVPLFQPGLFFIFLLYFFLNFDTLVTMHLDYKETKQLKKKG